MKPAASVLKADRPVTEHCFDDLDAKAPAALQQGTSLTPTTAHWRI